LHGLCVHELHALDCADVHLLGGVTALHVAAHGHARRVFLGPATALLLQEWLTGRNTPPPAAPLFVPLGRRHSPRRLSQGTIARLVRRAWAEARAGAREEAVADTC